jgi:uncharacterized repeat protein (TIGR03837 family)
MTRRWDIFCSVIDNFGDVGVAWRLARMLATEHGIAVRLFIDDRARLARIAPAGDAGVTVVDWGGAQAPFDAGAAGAPGDTVIEAFGCGLPPAYVEAMAKQKPAPAWIVLEYLSAEPWIDSYHGLASPTAAALPRRFAFPGFTAASGGLLRERDLLSNRDAFQDDPAVLRREWQAIGIEPPGANELVVSLFCYAPAALMGMLDAWSEARSPVRCLVPEGVAEPAIASWCGRPLASAGDSHARGSLSLHRIAFRSQDDYDRLLWACDLNFVRGEDSFVRAQWAARPLIWEAYAQREQAHRTKVSAFLDRYLAPDALDGAGEAMRTFTTLWNNDASGADRAGAARAWAALDATLPRLRAHARQWSRTLEALPELGAHLVEMARRMV